ncbi:MarR family winged helix-turn-helix transcriptional regulator [Roseivirga sp. E12]|uniref:MarR family winged helix-turn-helix transcriptional regulator n=1 Tax=Roseivirga sp. E12 TaxID=2819237 RepID=UPI001ABC1601|nr:MarR family transcriptional regulator [Roseivirga sp. E12]MBO3698408.1 MarR family transcriptional regulator [Roseivirga sp. E12]
MGIEEDIKQGKKFENIYEKLVVNIMFTNSWVVDEQAKIFKPYGITTPQYNVLRILRGQYPDACTVNMIIDRMLDRMSNASRIVDRLENKELVERTVCKTDRRAKDVLITEKGLAVLNEVDNALQLWMKKMDLLSVQEAHQMNDCLDKLRTI